MFYHVIVTMNKKAKEVTKIYEEYDLTNKDNVINQFVKPYLSQKTFIIEGGFPPLNDIETLKVYSSEESIEKLFKQEQMEDERDRRNSDIVFLGFYTTKIKTVRKRATDITRDIFAEANLTNIKSVPTSDEVINSPITKLNHKVFIVHGHDDGMKETVARFIEKMGLTPIILHEQANNGKTVIEKFEKNSDVGFTIVLYTPCDVGGKSGSKEQKPRARQNVVFEHGYFIGKLGRERVVALHRDNIEPPSDIQGILYIPFDSGLWQLQLAKEMKQVGFNIDMNKI